VTCFARVSRFSAVFVTVGLMTFAVSVAAEESSPDTAGFTRLQDYLENFGSMRADFRQEVINSDREIIEETRGHVLLKKPGRFRWHYTEPFERVIVSDGTRVWL